MATRNTAAVATQIELIGDPDSTAVVRQRPLWYRTRLRVLWQRGRLRLRKLLYPGQTPRRRPLCRSGGLVLQRLFRLVPRP